MHRTRVVAFAAFMGLAACSSEPPFDYDGASTAEREAFLSGYANRMNAGFKAGLRASGALSSVYVQDPVVRAGERRIVLAARLKQEGASFSGDTLKVKQGLLAELCPGYLKGALGASRVKVTVNLLYAEGSTLFSVEQSEATCAKYAKGQSEKP